MKKLLLATVATLALAMPAWADNIILTATVDGTLVNTTTSANGTLDVSDVSFGTVYNLNSLSINTQTFLAPPGILNTNTLNVDQSTGGTHQLIIDILGQNLVGPGSLQALLSEFSVTGLTTGWNAQEQTFINGTLLSDTGVFTANSASADVVASAFVTNPFTAEARYTINSVGIGQFNGGIDINAVPGPVVGAGLPGLLGMLGFGGFKFWRRRKVAA
jgi:hypothetical protein